MADQNDAIDIVDQTNPWAEAFAALDKEDEKDDKADAEGSVSDTGDAANVAKDTANISGDGASSNDTEDSGESEDDTGGLDNLSGRFGQEDETYSDDDITVDEEYIKQFNDDIIEQAKEAAVRDVAQAFIRKGVRNKNGKIGASIDDPDICKRDEDGVPVFYNPDTGREFTGDNPRRQAKEWVDDYNAELAQAFNSACEAYVKKVIEVEQPKIETLKFLPTYEGLDPVRQRMFDSIVEDYEIKDKDGDVIGYSCDLNKALAAVNRQVKMIKEYAVSNSVDKSVANKNNEPALDMKSSSVASSKDKQPKSLAEALEMQQEKLLSDLRGK